MLDSMFALLRFNLPLYNPNLMLFYSSYLNKLVYALSLFSKYGTWFWFHKQAELLETILRLLKLWGHLVTDWMHFEP